MRKAWDHAIDLKRRICAKEEQDLFIIKSRERESTRICEESVEEGVH